MQRDARPVPIEGKLQVGGLGHDHAAVQVLAAEMQAVNNSLIIAAVAALY